MGLGWLKKGSVRYYGKPGVTNLVRIDFHASKEVPTGTFGAIMKAAGLKPQEGVEMINLKYSLVVEATEDPNFFSFYSPDLEGFTGVGHSVEDCLYKARWGMEEHVALLKERGLPVPKRNPNPKIIIQNEQRLAAVG